MTRAGFPPISTWAVYVTMILDECIDLALMSNMFLGLLV